MSFLIKAVEKAKKQGKGGKSASVLRDKKIEIDDDKGRSALTIKKPDKLELKVNYVNTRTQNHDLERLKNNKIVSLFDDIEVTDQVKLLRTQTMKKLKALKLEYGSTVFGMV